MALNFEGRDAGRSTGVGHVMQALSNVSNILQPLQNTVNDFSSAQRNIAINDATDVIMGIQSAEEGNALDARTLLNNGYLNAADKKGLNQQLQNQIQQFQKEQGDEILGSAIAGLVDRSLTQEFDSQLDAKNAAFKQVYDQTGDIAQAQRFAQMAESQFGIESGTATRAAVNDIIANAGDSEFLASFDRGIDAANEVYNSIIAANGSVQEAQSAADRVRNMWEETSQLTPQQQSSIQLGQDALDLAHSREQGELTNMLTLPEGEINLEYLNASRYPAATGSEYDQMIQDKIQAGYNPGISDNLRPALTRFQEKVGRPPTVAELDHMVAAGTTQNSRFFSNGHSRFAYSDITDGGATRAVNKFIDDVAFLNTDAARAAVSAYDTASQDLAQRQTRQKTKLTDVIISSAKNANLRGQEIDLVKIMNTLDR